MKRLIVRTCGMQFPYVDISKGVVQDVVTMARHHLFRTGSKIVHRRPDALQRLAVCHADSREIVVRVFVTTRFLMCGRVEFANSGERQGPEAKRLRS